MSPETAAANDHQNSEHPLYIAGRDSKSWSHIPLEMSTLLLGGVALAGHIRSLVQAAFSGTIDIHRNFCRLAEHYRRRPARKRSIEVRKSVSGAQGSDARASRRSHARTWMACGRSVSCYRTLIQNLVPTSERPKHRHSAFAEALLQNTPLYFKSYHTRLF